MTDFSAEQGGDSIDPHDTAAADMAAMERLREGNDTALNELMDRWRKPILAYLYRTVGNYETAADLSQEVFVRLYRSRKKYRTSGSFPAFIFTIASNLTKNHFRWKKRHPETELNDKIVAGIGVAPEGTVEIDPAQSLEKNEAAVVVRGAVQRLPEKLRNAVVLFHFNDLSHVEIAAILRCSEKTVETRLYRGRKLLHGWLGEASEL